MAVSLKGNSDKPKKLKKEEPLYDLSANLFGANPKGAMGYDPKADRTYRETTPAKAPGIAGLGAGFGNFLSDTGRNLGNWLSTTGSYFGSHPEPKAGQGFGDYLFGSQRSSAKAPRRGYGGSFGEPVTEPAAEQEQWVPMSIMDAYNQLTQMQGDVPYISYDPLRQAATNRTNEYDARLAAMYKQLQNSYAADVPLIDAAYNEAITGTNASSDAAVSNINNAYNKAHEDQLAELARLGIADATGVIASHGDAPQADQARAVGNLEQSRGSFGNLLRANQRTAGDFTRQGGVAAGLEGNLQRASNLSRLQDILAQLDVQEQTANAQAQGAGQTDMWKIAQQLVDDNWRAHEYGDTRSDKEFNKELAAKELLSKYPRGGQTLNPDQITAAADALIKAQGGVDPRSLPGDEYRKWLNTALQLYPGY